MSERSVRNSEEMPEQLDYSNLPPEVKDVVAEQVADITEKEANISYDGKQYLFRFPKDIAKAIGIKEGDRIKIKVTLHSPKVGGGTDIEFKYAGKNG